MFGNHILRGAVSPVGPKLLAFFVFWIVGFWAPFLLRDVFSPPPAALSGGSCLSFCPAFPEGIIALLVEFAQANIAGRRSPEILLRHALRWSDVESSRSVGPYVS